MPYLHNLLYMKLLTDSICVSPYRANVKITKNYDYTKISNYACTYSHVLTRMLHFSRRRLRKLFSIYKISQL